jgi:hypothetical protein
MAEDLSVGSNAVFQEVLQVSLDRSNFANDLQWMVEQYNQAVQNMGSDAAGLASLNITKGLSDQINQLLDAVTGVTAKVHDATEETSSQISDVIARLDQKDAEVTQKRLERLDLIAEKQKEVAGGGAGNVSGADALLGDFASTFASMAKYYAMWQAIQGVVDAISFSIEAPFKALGEGLQYSQTLEQQAEQLSGAMLQSAKFSDNFAENLRISRDTARELVQLMQDRSIALGIKPEDLQNTFKGLMGAGAANLVGSPQELEQVAEMFQSALKSQGVGKLTGQLSNNTLIKLFNGEVQPDNKILNFFQISDEKWKSMVASAKEHHDLVSQLAPLIAPYLDSVEKANVTQAALVERFELLKQKIEALAATPLFGFLSENLKQLDTWLQSNQDKIAAFLGVFSDGIVRVGQALKELSSTDAFVAGMKIAAVAVMQIKDDIVTAAQTVELLAKVAGNVSKFGTVQGGAMSAADIGNFLDQQKALYNQDDLTRLRLGGNDPSGAYAKYMNQSAGTSWQGTRAPVQMVSDLRSAKDEFAQAKAEFLQEVEGFREQLKNAQAGIDQEVASRKITYQTALAQLADAVGNEQNQILKAFKTVEDAYAESRSKILGDKASTPEQRKSALSNLDTQHTELQTSLKRTFQQSQDSLNKEETAALKDRQATQDDWNKYRLAAAAAEARQEQAILDAQHRDGLRSDVEYIDARLGILQREHDTRQHLLDQEIQHVAVGTRQYNDLLIERAKDDQAYTNTVKMLAVERTRAEDQAQKDKDQHFNNLAAGDISGMQERSTLHHSLNPLDIGTDFEVTNAQLKENQALITQAQLYLNVAKAKGEELKVTQQLEERLQSEYNNRLKLINAQVQQMLSSGGNPATNRMLAGNIVQGQITTARGQLTGAINKLGSTDDSQERAKLSQEIQDLAKWIGELNDAFQSAIPDIHSSLENLVNNLVGFDFQQKWDAASTSVQKAAVAADAVTGAFGALNNSIGAWKQGTAQGGTLGGIGAEMSNFASLTGPAAPFVAAAGSVFSFIGGILKAAAQHIADDVKKQFQKTVDAYQNGTASLVQTITSLEAERQSAIQRLSGKKGGKDQLDQLLPEFDNEIASLKKQQKDLITNFEQQLTQLKLHSDTLAQIHSQWAAINKQVQDYIGAGGSAANAAAMLSEQLYAMRNNAMDEYNQSEQTAIQDAISLNSLLQQRVQLQKTFAQQEFDLINADAVERRGTGAVSRGKQLADLQEQESQQLNDLNYQIQTAQMKVTAESKVFKIASDINELHREDDALTLAALEQQLQKAQDLKKIIAGITLGANGQWQAGGLGLSGVNVIVNVTGSVSPGNAQQIGAGIGSGLINEINRGGRMTPP